MKAIAPVEAAEWMGGRYQGPAETRTFTGISIDSRTVSRRDLFFAIVGQNHDGHRFVDDAFSRDAAGAVVCQSGSGGENRNRPIIHVPDTTEALGKLAGRYRDEISASVIAVTGSNGKTTTREMIHHLLAGTLRGRQARKSFNNHIGVPLTLLSADEDDEYLVLELGTNHPGEIDALAGVARPDVGVLTTVSEAHLEGLSSLEGVIREKTSLFRHVRMGGAAMIHADPALRTTIAALRKHLEVLTFGKSLEADFRLTRFVQKPENIRFNCNNGREIRMPVLGEHHAVNALAAIAVARRFGLSDEEITNRLASFTPPAMRLERMTLGESEIIFDAYNANPASARAAIDVLDALDVGRRKVLVLADMRELGAQSEALHRALGGRIAQSETDVVVAVGKMAGVAAEMCPVQMTCHGYMDAAGAATDLDAWWREGDLVLLKGSRAMNLEIIVERMRERLAPATT